MAHTMGFLSGTDFFFFGTKLNSYSHANLMLKNSHEPTPTLATHSLLNTMAIAAFAMMANVQYVIQLGLFELNLDDDEEEDFGEQVCMVDLFLWTTLLMCAHIPMIT